MIPADAAPDYVELVDVRPRLARGVVFGFGVSLPVWLLFALAVIL